LIAIQFEERDLVRFHAEYAEYRRRVPMLLPIGSKNRTRSQDSIDPASGWSAQGLSDK